jgi:hypothetical protein
MTPMRTALATTSGLGWRSEVADGTAHVPHIEQPARFLACLGGLLAEPTGASRGRPQAAVR